METKRDNCTSSEIFILKKWKRKAKIDMNVKWTPDMNRDEEYLLKDLELCHPLHVRHQLRLVVIRGESGPKACL